MGHALDIANCIKIKCFAKLCYTVWGAKIKYFAPTINFLLQFNIEKNSEVDPIFKSLHSYISKNNCAKFGAFVHRVHKILLSFLTNMTIPLTIKFAGPPSGLDITYNSSDSTLCFSAYSHAEFPVRNFTVEVTDATGIASDLTDTYTSGPLCLNVTSDPIPDICFPFDVSVTASNDIGTTSVMKTITSNLVGERV